WLRFDDAAGATTYADASGSIPANDGQCGGPAGSCSILEGGGRYGSALQLSGTGYVEVPLDVSESAYGLALWFKTSCDHCGIFSVIKGTADHDRHVYLSNGNICARIYSNETVCTSGGSFADGQWHQVVHTFGGNVGGQKIYVDGQLRASGTKASSDFTSQDGIKIGFSHDAGTPYFSGQIDDVRLYPSALSPAQVESLFNQPVFHMNFDQHTVSGWKDVSGFDAPVHVFASPYAPTATPAGRPGWGGAFDGEDGLKVGDDSVERSGQLALSGGKFTLSAWLYPDAACPPDWLNGQVILGTDVDDPGWWGLWIMGPDPWGYTPGHMEFFFRDAGGSLAYVHNIQALPQNAWNHLVLTYDKDAAQSGLVKVYLNGELNSQQELQNASGPHPQPLPSRHFYFGGQAEENAIYNQSATFCGTIDEVAIFNHVLTDSGVEDLLLESATALHLPLDEPPGATAFADSSTLQRAAACGEPDCPTAGVGGRINQALGFNTAPGHSGDHLILGNSEINSLTDRLTVAAWIKPDSVTGIQRIAGTATTKTMDGWGFGTSGAELTFSM
ncbi:MAG: LamG domain-containing protein, partial [Anaerolineae bacterium]